VPVPTIGYRLGHLDKVPYSYLQLNNFRRFGLSASDALHGGFAQPSFGHGAGAPMGRAGGLGLGSGPHDLVHALGSIGDPPAPARCDLGEGVRAALQEALAPEDDGATTEPTSRAIRLLGKAIGGKEGNPGPEGDASRSVLGTDPGILGPALLGRYREGIS